MNEEMQKQLAKILELMISGLEKAGDVAGKELPGLINDYLSYYVIEALPFASMVWMIAGIVVGFWIYKIVTNLVKEDEAWMPLYNFLLIPVFVVTLATAEILGSAKEIAQITYAPKAYIIEKLRK